MKYFTIYMIVVMIIAMSVAFYFFLKKNINRFKKVRANGNSKLDSLQAVLNAQQAEWDEKNRQRAEEARRRNEHMTSYSGMRDWIALENAGYVKTDDSEGYATFTNFHSGTTVVYDKQRHKLVY